MELDILVLAVVLNVLIIVGGILIILMAMYQRGKRREMHHRERLAMIERGLAPPPELDPSAFDEPPRRHPPATGVGIVIVALGLGLWLIIGVAGGNEDAAAGVGGAIAVLGAAFITLGELQRRSQEPVLRTGASPPPTHPPEPPGSR